MDARELAINHTLTSPAPQQLKCAFNPALAIPVQSIYGRAETFSGWSCRCMKWSNISCATQGIFIAASLFVGKVLLIPAQQSGHGVVCDELQENVFGFSACLREKMV